MFANDCRPNYLFTNFLLLIMSSQSSSTIEGNKWEVRKDNCEYKTSDSNRFCLDTRYLSDVERILSPYCTHSFPEIDKVFLRRMTHSKPDVLCRSFNKFCRSVTKTRYYGLKYILLINIWYSP